MNSSKLDTPERYDLISRSIKGKKSLNLLYKETYNKYKLVASRAPKAGAIIEIGSGAGIAKEFLPELITTDIISYPNVDMVLDATNLTFNDHSVSAFLMQNVLHHVEDIEAFLEQAYRCLIPGGKIFLMEPYFGWYSKPLYHFHHEPCDTNAASWKFNSSGPLSDANIALPWIIFYRDRIIWDQKFSSKYSLQLSKPHTSFRYWLTGGMKCWNLFPGFSYKLVTQMEKTLEQITPGLGCFFDAELTKLH